MSTALRVAVWCGFACLVAVILTVVLAGDALRRYHVSRLPWKAQVMRDGSRIHSMASLSYELGCAVLEIGRVRIVLPGRGGILDGFDSMVMTLDLPFGVGSAGRSQCGNITWSRQGKGDGLHCDLDGLRFVIDQEGIFRFDSLAVDIDSDSVIYLGPDGKTELISSLHE